MFEHKSMKEEKEEGQEKEKKSQKSGFASVFVFFNSTRSHEIRLKRNLMSDHF